MEDKEIAVLYEDADVNYHAGRLEDSRKGFAYLFEQTKKNSLSSNPIYFMYRLVVIDELGDNHQELITHLKNLGFYCLQQAARVCAQQIERERDLHKKLRVMEEMRNILMSLNEESNLVKLTEMMIPLYQKISQEHDLPLQKRISHLSLLLNLLDPQDERITEVHEELAGFYHKLAVTSKSSNPQAAKEAWLQSRIYYELAQNKTKVAKIERLLENLE